MTNEPLTLRHYVNFAIIMALVLFTESAVNVILSFFNL